MHRRLLASVLAGIAMTLLAVDATAQRLTLRSSGGPANAELTERLSNYQPGVTVVPPITRDALWSGAADFRRGATSWIDAGAPGDEQRRRLVVATYALDLLKTFEDRTLWSATQPAGALLEWACTTLRKSDLLVQPAELAWHVAALALLERSGPAEVVKEHLDHAEARFPANADLLLVRALVDELESEEGRRDDGTLSISGALTSRARQHFQQAAARPSTRQQALIRWAAFESDLGRHDAALAHLVEAGRPASPVLRYWLGVVRGRTLERLNRGADAIDAYRAVVAEFPHAQVATLSLAAALVDAHRVVEAAGVVEAAVTRPTGPAPPADPWEFYRVPEVLLWPAAFEELRRAVAPQ